MTYVADPSEENTTVTVEYQVCYVANSVCDTATVTMNIGASCDVSDPAIDCDGDGNPNGTDPNPSTATAVDDGPVVGSYSGTTTDILSNDDFLP